jgi:hypothetical protein
MFDEPLCSVITRNAELNPNTLSLRSVAITLRVSGAPRGATLALFSKRRDTRVRPLDALVRRRASHGSRPEVSRRSFALEPILTSTMARSLSRSSLLRRPRLGTTWKMDLCRNK